MGILSVEVDFDPDAIVNSIQENLFTDEVRTEIVAKFAEMCDPYVPYNTGKLAGSVQISPEGLTYTAEYAGEVYNGIGINFRKDYHPFATAQWDKVMMTEQGELFMEYVSEILQNRIRELYG